MESLGSVIREGKERLYPSLTNPSWLVLQRRRKIFADWFSKLEGRELAVLDVGGRIQPYRPLLEGKVRSYVAVDLRPTPLVSMVAKAEQLPLADGSFDLAICTQVLQYVSEPGAVIAEIYRVLRPGGWLILSVPAVYPCDSEHDAWRFLSPGLKLLLGSFRSFEICPEGTSISGMFRSACVGMLMFARPAFVRNILRVTVVPVLNVAAAAMESMLRPSNDEFAANLSALGKK